MNCKVIKFQLEIRMKKKVFPANINIPYLSCILLHRSLNLLVINLRIFILKSVNQRKLIFSFYGFNPWRLSQSRWALISYCELFHNTNLVNTKDLKLSKRLLWIFACILCLVCHCAPSCLISFLMNIIAARDERNPYPTHFTLILWKQCIVSVVRLTVQSQITNNLKIAQLLRCNMNPVD